MSSFSFLDKLRGSFRNLSEGDQRAVRLGVIILLPALVWAGMVRPYADALRNLSEQIASEQALLDRERAVLGASRAFGARLEAVNGALDAWDGRLVRSPNLALAEAEVSAVLEDIARQSRVLLREVRATPLPPGTTPPDGLQPIRMSVSGESDFEGLLGFLHAIERDPLLFQTIGISLEGSGDDDDGVVPVTFIAIVEAFAPDNAKDPESEG